MPMSSALRLVFAPYPLLILAVWMGLYPESFLKPMRADIGRIVQRMERVAPAGDSRPTPGKPVPATYDEAAH